MISKIIYLKLVFIQLIFICISNFILSTLFAAENKINCISSQDVVLKRRLNNGNDFNYTFRYLCKDPNFINLIFIPGGPGSGSIDGELLNYKELDINLVLSDPRGVGRNFNFYNEGGTTSEINSALVADDIMSILEQFTEENKFAIYGTSYGTVIATILGSKLEKAHNNLKNRVHSIILDGTLAKSMDTQEQVNGLNEVFELMLQFYSYRLDDENIRKFNQNLNYIENKNYSKSLAALLSASLSNAFDCLLNCTLSEIDQLEMNINSRELGALEFYNIIVCKEQIFRGKTFNIKFEKRKFMPDDSKPANCSNIEESIKSYDSAEFQIHKPIIYISGLLDPRTSSRKQYQFL